MVDRLAPERRSRLMANVRSKDTGPERIVRSLLHRAGFRYRLHARDLPGKPDIVFRRQKKVIFVHGCFWHGHGCRYGQLPKSREDFWSAKIRRNCERDRSAISSLQMAGWHVHVVWQCELRNLSAVVEDLASFCAQGEKSDRLRRLCLLSSRESEKA